ncbi:hypothetical protein UFOVP1349_46 [uncultured Caudovirales phage]|uniref:Uncharacterized protein n=1 Tax=uncultured Caudovirales phage TaxID=2100421 RepID=A0A6J5RTC2_9CAUD|nr:hypothetical protein UFOVP925_54 [uncultured Caudovirales phage]CAB4184344.1 hypothetical protein UFOVP1097_52 [uncultured Caudovirales phage]CAB4200443.1 hypothetical protein UFOVP1349_46 [uncultured Caudovirales phage]CAB4214269.1 hypothetical protein UFOVP1456_26 [uncultured Caudovirales phage]
MTSIARTSGNSGALFDVSGTVPVNATWAEDIYFTEDAAPFVLTDLSFKMTFRRDPAKTSADYTLSTDDGTLSIEDDDDSYARILRINVPAGWFTEVGDFIADLASEDTADKVISWANGIVSFRNNPVTF